jgi:hypothetical protein
MHVTADQLLLFAEQQAKLEKRIVRLRWAWEDYQQHVVGKMDGDDKAAYRANLEDAVRGIIDLVEDYGENGENG